MDRRRFVKTTGGASLYMVSGAGLGSLVVGCDDSEITLPWDDWSPLVDRAYPKIRYFQEKDVSNNYGRVGFVRTDGSIFSFFLEKGPVNPVSGLEATLIIEDLYGKGFLAIVDPQKRCMPHVHIPFQLSKSKNDTKTSSSPFVTVSSTEDAKEIIKNIYVSEIKSEFPSPTFDLEKIDTVPGFVYRGEWSFDDFHKTVNLVKYASLIISPLDGGSSYSVLAKIGEIGNVMGRVIEGINYSWPESKNYVTRDKKYSIYTPASSISSLEKIFLSSRGPFRQMNEDISYLFPINEGSSWTFTDGRQSATLRASGTKKVKGKDLAVVKGVSGIEEYFGVLGKSWNQYGINVSSLGDVFFDPPIKLGDDQMRIGKSYKTISNIISSDSDISGKVDLSLECVAREKLVFPNNVPYGDCFKIKEYGSINIGKNGETGTHSSYEAYHWYAKNVGKIQMEFGKDKFWLLEKNLVSNKNSYVFKENLNLISPISQKIIEASLRLY